MKYYQNTPIKNWVAEDRPREKAIRLGVGTLTEAELIATLLATGTREYSAIDLGRKLLDQFGGLRSLAQASVKDLMSIKGIGHAKAICLSSAFELARRKLIEEQSRTQIRNSGSIFAFLLPKFMDLTHEEFHVIYLNRNNTVIGHKVVSSGGVSATVVDPRIVFKEAIQLMATAIVVAHNHPSGSLAPSVADDLITERLIAAAEFLDIKVLDHLILTNDDYFSYADKGDLASMRAKSKCSLPQFCRKKEGEKKPKSYVQELKDELAA